jgi:hypothetical protein
VQLTESFKLNTQEIEILRKQNKTLKYENERLSGASEENNNLVKEKVDLAARQSYQLKEVEGHFLSFYIMVVHITGQKYL